MGALSQSPSVGVLVVAHGHSGRELVSAAETIGGAMAGVEAVGHSASESRSELARRVIEAMERVDAGAGVLFMTDLFGSTPANVCLELVRAARNRTEVLFGVNLAMLVKLSSLDRIKLTPIELGVGLCETGRRSIKSGCELEAAPAAQDGRRP